MKEYKTKMDIYIGASLAVAFSDGEVAAAEKAAIIKRLMSLFTDELAIEENFRSFEKYFMKNFDTAVNEFKNFLKNDRNLRKYAPELLSFVRKVVRDDAIPTEQEDYYLKELETILCKY